MGWGVERLCCLLGHHLLLLLWEILILADLDLLYVRLLVVSVANLVARSPEPLVCLSPPNLHDLWLLLPNKHLVSLLLGIIILHGVALEDHVVLLERLNLVLVLAIRVLH